VLTFHLRDLLLVLDALGLQVLRVAVQDVHVGGVDVDVLPMDIGALKSYIEILLI
jgi:hypothetical protein